MITVINEFETLKTIKQNSSSISRFGDGEFKICAGYDNISQCCHPDLQKKLCQLLKGDLKLKTKHGREVLVAIPNIFGNYRKNKSTDFIKILEIYHKYFNPQMTYYSAFISRGDNAPDIMTKAYWDLFKSILDHRHVVSIEGIEVGKSKLISSYSQLLADCKSFKIIQGPNQDAFDHYQQLLTKAKTCPKDSLFLIGLGATATVLAYDLTVLGYQALDIGHLAMFYGRFLKNQKTD